MHIHVYKLKNSKLTVIGYNIDKYELQEKEIAFLKEQIEFLREYITSDTTTTSVPKDEYMKLEQENIKLKHRVAILKKVSL